MITENNATSFKIIQPIYKIAAEFYGIKLQNYLKMSSTEKKVREGQFKRGSIDK
jgi:hypothetical protein